jgi:hypothetical protein
VFSNKMGYCHRDNQWPEPPASMITVEVRAARLCYLSRVISLIISPLTNSIILLLLPQLAKMYERDVPRHQWSNNQAPHYLDGMT